MRSITNKVIYILFYLCNAYNLYYFTIRIGKFQFIIFTFAQSTTMKSSQNKSGSKSKSKGYNPNFKKDRMTDASHHDQFIFNKTPILASALKKLKNKSGSSIPKQAKRPPVQDLQQPKLNKKVKKNLQDMAPVLTYTPLQRDLFNFFTINKVALKNMQSVPQPKFQIGSTILTALCDRGIGGKFLVTNLFRNKKCYIDYMEVSLSKSNPQKSIETLQKYNTPGNFVIGTVVKGRSANQVQISLSTYLPIDQKNIKIGQTFPAEIKSKQELGCHLIVSGLKSYKVFLQKKIVSEQVFQQLQENKQIVVCVKEIDQKKKILKVALSSQEQIPMNFKGLEQQQLSKMDLDQYVSPGTIVHTKIIKVLPNGVMVKFLKIFIAYLHVDHLNRDISSYVVGEKLNARVIFLCVNPPTLFLSQKHLNLSPYQPKRPLYSQVNRPQDLKDRQNSFFNNEQEFFVHPSQLHTDLKNISKFWVKQNNYFEKYQIMTSKKIGVQVGQISKTIPFSNFKVYGGKQNLQGQKFRVLTLDVWNKVIKISYDKKILTAKNLLFSLQNVDQSIKYMGFIKNVNPNGVVIEFCNNIKGILVKNQLKLNQIQITTANIGEAFEVYITNTKKGYIGLTLKNPQLRKSNSKSNHKNVKQVLIGKESESKNEETSMGTIQSIDTKSINPIYIKIKQKLVKISIFNGICPPSVVDLHKIINLQDNFKVGDKIKVFRKGSQYYLYPPEQLYDKDLRFCRIITNTQSHLRLQTGKGQFKNCHISDITDIISPYPLSQYKVGQYTIGRVCQKDQTSICLRKSIVMKGIPKSMQQCITLYSNEQKNGDYRNRLLVAGSQGLKLQMLCFGYVKNFNEKGCFISLSKDYDVRVQMCQLSDNFLKDKEKIFKTNKLVLCRLINSKIKNNQPTNIMFDASLRESVIKYGYPLNDEILEHGVGLTVEGYIKGYTKGKALVQLNSSRFTGIISMHDIEGLGDQSLQKALPIGSIHKFKITQYSLQGDRRLIRLSTLKRVFSKFKEFQTTFSKDANGQKLLQSFRQLQAIQAPQQQKQVIICEQQNDEDQQERIRNLLNIQGGQEQQQEMEIQEPSNEKDQSQAQDQEQVQEMQQQNGQQLEQEENHQDQELNQNDPETKKMEHDEFRRRTALFEKMPHDPSFYHSLVLANPTVQSYLLYISSLLQTSTPQQIRTIFARAINQFTQIKDKDNMWISWINMEIVLGDLVGTVKKAIEGSVGMNVYFRILQILTQQQKWQVAIQFGRKMLKKYNREVKAYIQFLKLVNAYSLNHKVNDTISSKQIIRRASQCLKSNEIITIESHMAKHMFQINQNQKGRNIFEDILGKHPKRTDLWSMYVDMQIKKEQIQKARNLMQRILTIPLNKKQIKSMLKKYYKLQQQHGTEASAQNILMRAKEIAQRFIKQDDEDQMQIEGEDQNDDQ